MKKIHNFYFPDWDNHFKDYFNSQIGYQEAQRNRALSFVKEYKVAIDCGAHVGLWSRDLASFFDMVYCFEPYIEYFECLKANIKNNNAILINKGLGQEESKAKLHIPYNYGNSGNAKIINENDILKNEKDNIVDVQIIHLDKFELTKVDFIKIDVERLGMNVLEGAKETLNKCKPVICLELLDNQEKNEQISFLNKMGYKIVDKIIKEHVFIKI